MSAVVGTAPDPPVAAVAGRPPYRRGGEKVSGCASLAWSHTPLWVPWKKPGKNTRRQKNATPNRGASCQLVVLFLKNFPGLFVRTSRLQLRKINSDGPSPAYIVFTSARPPCVVVDD